MRERRSNLLLVPGLVLALAIATGGCGESDAPPTAPAAPVRTVVGTQRFTNLLPLGELHSSLQLSLSGTLDITVDWGSSANDVDVYVSDGACQSIVDHLFFQGGAAGNPRACTIAARANSASVKPERVASPVSTGTYRVWVFNNGPGTESGTLEVGVTR